MLRAMNLLSVMGTEGLMAPMSCPLGLDQQERLILGF